VSKSFQIITVTPAPAIDRTYLVSSLELGGVHRATRASAQFAGKGVNVTQALVLGGVSSQAIAPLTATDQEEWSGTSFLLGSPTSQSVRNNITILEPDGRTTKINEAAPALTESEWDALQALTLAEIKLNNTAWLLVAGTIPTTSSGTPQVLSSLLKEASELGCQVALDTSGPALLESARGGIPDFIKPNASELAECVSRPITKLGDVIDAGQEIAGWGVGMVVVSLGPDGIVGITAKGAVHSWTTPLKVLNTIGAGDASVAGFLAHQVSHPGDLAGAVSQAVAWGAQKVQQAGSQLETLASLPAVHSTQAPDRSLTLTEPGRF
jgi:1-phosphofructokinase